MRVLLGQAAQALRMTPERVRRLVTSGKLDGGFDETCRRWWVNRSSIERFLATAGEPRQDRQDA